MTTFLFGRRCLCVAILLAPSLCTAQALEDAPDKSWDGYLGVGLILSPDYAGSANTQTWLIPIANIEYKHVVYIYLNRVGVRLWKNDANTIALGLAGEQRFGYQLNDAPGLDGVTDRRDAFEGGPVMEWELPQLSLSLGYFADMSSVSGGRSVRLSFYRQLLDNDTWDLGTYFDFDYSNSQIVQYYFGVRPGTATTLFPYYQPGASLNSAWGLTGAYKLNKHHAILFGGELSFLGHAEAQSPIVQRRTGLTGYIGFGLVY